MLPTPVAFHKLSFEIVILTFFLTFRAKTSISEERIELCGAPGAIHSAEMTRPLSDDGTCVRPVGKFHFSFPVDGRRFSEAALLEFSSSFLVMIITIRSGLLAFCFLDFALHSFFKQRLLSRQRLKPGHGSFLLPTPLTLLFGTDPCMGFLKDIGGEAAAHIYLHVDMQLTLSPRALGWNG